jgi:putative lipoic acid-binding regulatory protein
MKKKIALFLVAALLSVGLIISCGGGGDDPDPGKDPGTDPGTNPSGTKYTVTFDLNGGLIGTDTTFAPIEVDAGKAVGSRYWPGDPTSDAGLFEGWFEGTTEYTSATLITKNVTVVAKYVWPDALLDFETFYQLGAFTYSNPPNQKGWLFGEGGDDYEFTDDTWLLLETVGGNMGGFGGLQVTFIDEYIDGEAAVKYEADTKGDWDAYNKGSDEVIYWAIKLSQHPKYDDFRSAVADGWLNLYIGVYPFTNLGFLNAYLVEEDLDKISENKILTLQKGTGPVYGFIVSTKDDGIDWDMLFDDTYVAVTGLNFNGGLTGNVDNAIALSATVVPANATNKTIVWTVKSGSASITGNNLTATAAGTVVVTATITNGATTSTNYTKDFTFKIVGLASEAFTVDLSDLLDASDEFEASTDGIINKSAYTGNYQEKSIILTGLVLPDDNTLENYTKLDIKAKFYKDDMSEIDPDDTWSLSALRFISDYNGYTTDGYPTNTKYIYNTVSNFGTNQLSSPPVKGIGIPIAGFLKDGELLFPEAINLQTTGEGETPPRGVAFIEIIEITFRID